MKYCEGVQGIFFDTGGHESEPACRSQLLAPLTALPPELVEMAVAVPGLVCASEVAAPEATAPAVPVLALAAATPPPVARAAAVPQLAAPAAAKLLLSAAWIAVLQSVTCSGGWWVE